MLENYVHPNPRDPRVSETKCWRGDNLREQINRVKRKKSRSESPDRGMRRKEVSRLLFDFFLSFFFFFVE